MKPLYYKDFLSHPYQTTSIFSRLMKLDWLEVTEARKEYFMSNVPRSYEYGKGINARTYTSNPYTNDVSWIQKQFDGYCMDLGFNVCFLNRYDNQKNALGWHADDSPSMDHDHPIAVVSFGAEREIWWKKKEEKGLVPPEQRQVLHNGSLFVMPAGFQRDHYHKIPKCDHSCGVRISLTFRRYM